MTDDNTIEIMYRPEYGWVLRHKGVEYTGLNLPEALRAPWNELVDRIPVVRTAPPQFVPIEQLLRDG